MEDVSTFVDALLFEHGEVVTYIQLSKYFKISIDLAKILLYAYAQDRKGKLFVCYLISGKTNKNEFYMSVLQDYKIDDVRKKMSEVSILHVYSVKALKNTISNDTVWLNELKKISLNLTEAQRNGKLYIPEYIGIIPKASSVRMPSNSSNIKNTDTIQNKIDKVDKKALEKQQNDTKILKENVIKEKKEMNFFAQKKKNLLNNSQKKDELNDVSMKENEKKRNNSEKEKDEKDEKEDKKKNERKRKNRTKKPDDSFSECSNNIDNAKNKMSKKLKKLTNNSKIDGEVKNKSIKAKDNIEAKVEESNSSDQEDCLEYSNYNKEKSDATTLFKKDTNIFDSDNEETEIEYVKKNIINDEDKKEFNRKQEEKTEDKPKEKIVINTVRRKKKETKTYQQGSYLVLEDSDTFETVQETKIVKIKNNEKNPNLNLIEAKNLDNIEKSTKHSKGKKNLIKGQVAITSFFKKK